jgi:hypothetical protein
MGRREANRGATGDSDWRGCRGRIVPGGWLQASHGLESPLLVSSGHTAGHTAVSAVGGGGMGRVGRFGLGGRRRGNCSDREEGNSSNRSGGWLLASDREEVHASVQRPPSSSPTTVTCSPHWPFARAWAQPCGEATCSTRAAGRMRPPRIQPRPTMPTTPSYTPHQKGTNPSSRHPTLSPSPTTTIPPHTPPETRPEVPSAPASPCKTTRHAFSVISFQIFIIL